MTEETVLQVFFELHSNLPREGPGNDDATAQALALLPALPDQPQILDLGCGPGMQTLALARLTNGHVTAVDIHQPYLNQLQQRAEAAGLSDRLRLLNEDMAQLSLPAGHFDLIWAEGSAYILEFGNALRIWRSLLKPSAYLAATEISWLRDTPSPKAVEFWKTEYPGLQSVEGNLSLAKSAGYLPLAHFVLPESAWWQHYYTPLEQQLHQLTTQYADNSVALDVLESHQQEINLYRECCRDYGYVFYILQAEN